MFSQSIRRKIVGIALGLVVLMIATSILSTLMANRVGHLLDELTNKYLPAYGDLARAHVRSLEGALALRQMVIAKMQTPPDDVAFAQRMQIYRTKDAEVTEEAEAARKLIGSIIEDTSTPSDNVALALIDGRIEAAVTDVRRLLNEEHSQLISQLEAHDFPEVQRSLQRTDVLRDQFNERIDQIRAGMLAQVHTSAATVMVNQQRAIWITVIVTAIAAILGLLFAGLVGGGITRPVRLLLQSTRDVEAGQLDRSIDVVTRDEIGQLTAAFNRMVGQLRQKDDAAGRRARRGWRQMVPAGGRDRNRPIAGRVLVRRARQGRTGPQAPVDRTAGVMTEAAPLIIDAARPMTGRRIPVRNLWLLLLYASDLARFGDRFDAAVEESPICRT